MWDIPFAERCGVGRTVRGSGVWGIPLWEYVLLEVCTRVAGASARVKTTVNTKRVITRSKCVITHFACFYTVLQVSAWQCRERTVCKITV